MQNKDLRELKLSDIESPESLRNWIKKNLENIYMNNEVSNDHLLIYLDYLKSNLKKTEEIDVPCWSRSLTKLQLTVEKLLKWEEYDVPERS